jgi:hypothetical protein
MMVGSALLAAVVLLLVPLAGTATAQPTVVSPANGASFARDASITFTLNVPPGTIDTSIAISSSSATNSDGSLASPLPSVYVVAVGTGGTAATGSWLPSEQAVGTYYWQATSFVCPGTAPTYSCPGNELSPVESLVLTALPPPAPVSPANGATQTVSSSTKFVFTPNAQPDDTKLMVVFSTTNSLGPDGVLSQPAYTTADLTSDEGIGTNSNVSASIPGSLDVPGTVYWQPVRVNCYDNPIAPCNVPGPVSALTLKAKPPPPLHLQLSGGTTVRIRSPRIAVTVSCSEACTGSVNGKASVRVGGKTVSDGLLDPRGTKFTATVSQPESFRSTYTGSALKALAHAVASHGYVQLTMTVTAEANNGGGNAHEERSIFIRPNPPPPPPPAPKTAPPPTQSSTVDVEDFSGNTLAVDAYLFADPATPATQFDAPSSGDVLIAIGLHLTDRGPGTVSSDVNSDTSLVGSNGQVYTPSFDDVQGCTNFDFGGFTLFNGESETGCVIFELPNGAGISRVAFSLGENTAQWINNG